MTRRTKRSIRYGHHCTDRVVRLVWAMVTRHPRWSTVKIAAALMIDRPKVAAACRMLRDAGYIDYTPGQDNSRVVVIPLYVKRMKRS